MKLIFLLYFTICCFSQNEIKRENCGDHCEWEYRTDFQQNELIIRGHGEMNNYVLNNLPPWSNYTRDIKKITIEEGITSIGRRAFYECSNVSTITIPKTITSIEPLSLSHMTKMKSFNVHFQNKHFCVIDDVLLSYNKSILFNYPIGKNQTSYEIPFGVKEYPGEHSLHSEL